MTAIAIIIFGIAIFIKSGAWFLGIFFLVLALYALIQSRTSKPIMIIYYNGIWTPKAKLIYWSDISSLNTVSDYISEAKHTHEIVFVTNDKKIKIDFTISDQSMYEIRNAIQFFSAGHDVVDNGHITIPENHLDY